MANVRAGEATLAGSVAMDHLGEIPIRRSGGFGCAEHRLDYPIALLGAGDVIQILVAIVRELIEVILIKLGIGVQEIRQQLVCASPEGRGWDCRCLGDSGARRWRG